MNDKHAVLETEKLFVRQAHTNDAFEIADYFNRNRKFHKQFDPIRPEEFFTESFWVKLVETDLLKFKKDQSLRLFIFHRNTPRRVIGMIHFSGFIRGAFQATYLGYSLDENQQGNGYMNQALRKTITYLFQELNFHRIMANCMVSNEKSLLVLKKLKFTVEGTAGDYLFINGKWEDHILTALINKQHSFNQ